MTWRVQREYIPERLDWLYVIDFGVGTNNRRHLSVYAETELGIDINGPAGNDGLDNLFNLLKDVCKEMDDEKHRQAGGDEVVSEGS